MIRSVLAVFDRKAKLFDDQLIVVVTPQVGVRSFTEAVNNPQSPWFKYPEDFSLHRVAEYDDVTGRLTAVEPVPELVVSAVNVLRPKDDGDQRKLALEA